MGVIGLVGTPFGTKSGSLGLSEDVQGLKRSPNVPKRALLGTLGVQLSSLKGPKHMILMQPTQLD